MTTIDNACRHISESAEDARRARLAGNPVGAAQWAEFAAGARREANRMTAVAQINSPTLIAAMAAE